MPRYIYKGPVMEFNTLLADIWEGEIYLHYLETGQYTYLAGEINALYHEAAVKTGISDSDQNILYVLSE